MSYVVSECGSARTSEDALAVVERLQLATELPQSPMRVVEFAMEANVIFVTNHHDIARIKPSTDVSFRGSVVFLCLTLDGTATEKAVHLSALLCFGGIQQASSGGDSPHALKTP
jgi:hypothetical protein